MLDAQGPSRGIEIAEPRETKLLDAEAGVVVEGHREPDCFRTPIREAFELRHRLRVPYVILDVHRLLRLRRETHNSRALHSFEDGIPDEPQEAADVLKELGLVFRLEAALFHPGHERADFPLSPFRGMRGDSTVRERLRNHSELSTALLGGQ